MGWVHLMGAWCLRGALGGGNRAWGVTGSWILMGAPYGCMVPKGGTWGGVIAHRGSPGAGHREQVAGSWKVLGARYRLWCTYGKLNRCTP
jgi:hypothetical protein